MSSTSPAPRPASGTRPGSLPTRRRPETAVAVQRLLDAGADLAGKTHTDELAYSLTGENRHYGTPVNARAPDRIPGGSSNGSAAAVAAGLVDFAIGTRLRGLGAPARELLRHLRYAPDGRPRAARRGHPFRPALSTSPAGSRAMRRCWSGSGACSSPMTRSPVTATSAASRRGCLRAWWTRR